MNNHQFLRLPPLVWKFLNEATIDSVLLAAMEQFKDQTTTRLIITVLEEYEDSGTSYIIHLDTKYLMVKTLAGKDQVVF